MFALQGIRSVVKASAAAVGRIMSSKPPTAKPELYLNYELSSLPVLRELTVSASRHPLLPRKFQVASFDALPPAFCTRSHKADFPEFLVKDGVPVRNLSTGLHTRGFHEKFPIRRGTSRPKTCCVEFIKNESANELQGNRQSELTSEIGNSKPADPSDAQFNEESVTSMTFVQMSCLPIILGAKRKSREMVSEASFSSARTRGREIPAAGSSDDTKRFKFDWECVNSEGGTSEASKVDKSTNLESKFSKQPSDLKSILKDPSSGTTSKKRVLSFAEGDALETIKYIDSCKRRRLSV